MEEASKAQKILQSEIMTQSRPKKDDDEDQDEDATRNIIMVLFRKRNVSIKKDSQLNSVDSGVSKIFFL